MRKFVGIIFIYLSLIVLCIRIVKDVIHDATLTIGIIVFLSCVFLNYFVLIPSENMVLVKKALQGSDVTSEKLAVITGISVIEIEGLRGNIEYSENQRFHNLNAGQMKKLANELGVNQKKRSFKKFILTIILFIVMLILLDFLFAPI